MLQIILWSPKMLFRELGIFFFKLESRQSMSKNEICFLQMQIIKSKLNIHSPIEMSLKSPDTLFCHLRCLFGF